MPGARLTAPVALVAAAVALRAAATTRCAALDPSLWAASEWLSVPDAPVFEGVAERGCRAAPGTSRFASARANPREVKSVKWMTAGLGVYEVYVNGRRVGEDFLKPGFTHNRKTKYSFTYDVTDLVDTAAGATNAFAAEVSAGWWRDKICTPHHSPGGYVGRKSAFRGVLEFAYADGTTEVFGTNVSDWRAGIAGPVLRAAIFDGEFYDARLAPGPMDPAGLGQAERNDEFKGEILPTAGAEVLLRRDIAMAPVAVYAWRGVEGADEDHFGTVRVVRTFAAGGPVEVLPGETLVADFGQNAAAVPSFAFSAARGVTLAIRPAEALNDGNGAKTRGCDGPEGSVYRANLRAGWETDRLAEYTFAGSGREEYTPRFTYFGYRYISLTADGGPVRIEKMESVPVTSIAAEQERGRIRTGDAAVNRLFANALWGQRSNYLSIPTDCPQRNERLGWTADTQVFAETALFNADVAAFLRKWMRDMRDSQLDDGSFPSVAPFAQCGNEGRRAGWADAGVVVPYTVWKMSGDTAIIRENFAAMERFLALQDATRYRTATMPDGRPDEQYGDWLSFEDYERGNGTAYEDEARTVLKPAAVRYWDFMAGCHWARNARMMREMSAAVGDAGAAAKYAAMAERAMAYVRREFVDPADGMILKVFRHLQGAAVFALAFGVLEDAVAVEATKAALRRNIEEHGGCNMTGFLGTPLIMDALTENGMADVAYSLLLNHNFPSWLYSVDQGATTIWERWNSYTKKDGFGPVRMNSFNHYAYGCVMGWVYRTVCGIAADPEAPGFRNIVMKPVPDRRLGFAEAEFDSPAGLVKSAWRYDGDVWTWTFTVPEGATATVTLPDSPNPARYTPGTYTVKR